MKKIINGISLLIGLSIPVTLWPQTGIHSAGGDVSGANGTVSFSVGQLFYAAIGAPDLLLTEGVQQPYELLDLNATSEPFPYQVALYPNPVSGLLTIQVSTPFNGVLLYSIVDEAGQSVLSGTLAEEQTQLIVSPIPAGVYMLTLVAPPGRMASYRLVKM
jgi:hypothetical protein